MANTKNTVVRFDTGDFNKLKFILWYLKDGKSQNGFITDAVKKEIAAYERKHGEITEKQLKDARII